MERGGGGGRKGRYIISCNGGSPHAEGKEST